MSKKLLIAVAVISFALVGTTFAAVENIKVSGDITAQAITRDLSLGATAGLADPLTGTTETPRDQEDFLFSQVRLRIDADLTENVSAVVRLINERRWGAEMVGAGTADDTNIDLDLGYVELKEFLGQAMSLTVGRQNLHYGSGLVVGDPDTNQTSAALATILGDLSLRKSFDAVRAVFDYSPYTLDLIYAKPSDTTTNINDDATLFGANLAYQWASNNGLTELYFFGSDNARLPTPVQDKNSKTYVAGARTQWDPNDHLTIALEGAYQFGDYRSLSGPVSGSGPAGDRSPSEHAHLSAYAGLATVNYRLLNDYNFQLSATYALLSGDDPTSGSYEGWDAMYEDQTPAELMNIFASSTNAHVIRVEGSMMPREDTTIGLIYNKIILAEKLPSTGTVTEGAANTWTNFSPFYGTASGNTYAIDNSERDFADEIDAYAVYDYTEDVQFKILSAWFIPGDFFASANDDTVYSVRGSLAVAF